MMNISIAQATPYGKRLASKRVDSHPCFKSIARSPTMHLATAEEISKSAEAEGDRPNNTKSQGPNETQMQQHGVFRWCLTGWSAGPKLQACPHGPLLHARARLQRTRVYDGDAATGRPLGCE